MYELKNEELKEINGGGLTFNASLFNALARGMEISLEIGRSFGSSLRRALSNCRCKL